MHIKVFAARRLPLRLWEINLIGRAARTRHPCSDYCCGNPRTHWGERTVQERRALLPVED